MNQTTIESPKPQAPARGRRRKGLKLAAWTLALLVLIGGGLFGTQRFLKQDEQATLRTVRVEIGDLERNVTAVGSVKPKEYVDVGTQVGGRVEKIHVQIGDRVKKGALIAEIDPTVYQSTVNKGEANLENLKAQLGQQRAELELARQQLARNTRLLASNAVSQDTVDQVQAAAKVAEARVAALQAQIRAADATLVGDKANLGFTKIYAPMDGTVVSQTVLKGQTVNAVQSAPVIVQIAKLDVMTVWAQVAEADVNKVKKGMPAYFTTLGNADKRWRGSIEQVQPTPSIKNDVVLYNVLIDVENAEGLLLPSMTVQVFFSLGEAKGVPLVPLTALKPDRQAGAGAFRAVVVTEKGQENRVVKVGMTNRTSAQVISGLEPGERVVVEAPPAAASTSNRQGRSGVGGGPRL